MKKKQKNNEKVYQKARKLDNKVNDIDGKYSNDKVKNGKIYAS